MRHFRRTVLLAEKLEVKVIVGFSGCPGANPTDKNPNWITYRWPDEYGHALDWQWKEKVIPYWHRRPPSRAHGIRRLALEMHPNFTVYNPRTLLKLRNAVGEEIGANCDLSHLFWQQCDPVEVIRLLGKQGAIFHAHMKDTVLYKHNVDRYGVLNFAFETKEIPEASANFRAVGYGHGAELWKKIVRAYMDIGYQGILSIENEDPILTGEVGVERAAYVLKNVRAELLSEGSRMNRREFLGASGAGLLAARLGAFRARRSKTLRHRSGTLFRSRRDEARFRRLASKGRRDRIRRSRIRGLFRPLSARSSGLPRSRGPSRTVRAHLLRPIRKGPPGDSRRRAHDRP